NEATRRCSLKNSSRPRLSVEPLEARNCPSVSAHVVAGRLLITGSSFNLNLTEESATATSAVIKVTDNHVNRGSFTVTDGVIIRLGRGEDNVEINLNGHTLPGGVAVDLGNGNNSLTVRNGTIGRWLAALGGTGTDRVTLGSAGPSQTLTVNGDTIIGLGG